MQLCCGVDGCPGGWICIRSPTEAAIFTYSFHPRFTELIDSVGPQAVIAVDMPVGLTAAGPRECDLAARQYLGFPRSASVFSAPIRPALGARTWRQASQIRERIDRKRYQQQAWGLFPKVREVDTLLRAHPRYQSQVFEAHPEVTFAAMNDGLAMAHPKKQPAGRKERLSLVERHLGPEALAVYEDARRHRRKFSPSHLTYGALPPDAVGRDDILDALALVWTAHRIAAVEHGMLPEMEERDPMGLSMNINY